ncbi:MAG: Methyltransferase type 12 [Bacillales bacterium]|jgi:SAM-dependent methyltransferase|nr:Methyltransferase type 12 [Bacillales bacterium]
MSFSNYGELCTEVYDLTKKIGQSFGGDIEFYKERLKDIEGNILEAMVGSGRVLIPLLEAGINIEGVDYSKNMLASCQATLDERGLVTNLYQGDLTKLSLPKKFDAIIIPASSILLIDNREDSIKSITSLYNQLNPGGKLILDISLPDNDFLPNENGSTSVFTLPNGDTITMEKKLTEVDFLNQFKVYLLKYEKWRNGSLIQTELQRFALRWYGVEEFRLLLKEIGFSKINITADYLSGKQPDNKTGTFVFEATK